MTCTTPDCGNPTDLYLCRDCILELDDITRNQAPFLIENLDPVKQATKVTRKPGSEGGGGGKSGSKPAMNLDAHQLREWLSMLPESAHAHATNSPEAGRTVAMARIWVHNAERLVYGEEPKPASDGEEILRRLKEKGAKPMRTGDIVKWLREHAKISINKKHIYNWAERDYITRQNPGVKEHPTYDPVDVYTAYVRHAD